MCNEKEKDSLEIHEVWSKQTADKQQLFLAKHGIYVFYFTRANSASGDCKYVSEVSSYFMTSSKSGRR